MIIPNVIDPYGSSDRAAANSSTAGRTPVPNLDFANARTETGYSSRPKRGMAAIDCSAVIPRNRISYIASTLAVRVTPCWQ